MIAPEKIRDLPKSAPEVRAKLASNCDIFVADIGARSAPVIRLFCPCYLPLLLAPV